MTPLRVGLRGGSLYFFKRCPVSCNLLSSHRCCFGDWTVLPNPPAPLTGVGGPGCRGLGSPGAPSLPPRAQIKLSVKSRGPFTSGPSRGLHCFHALSHQPPLNFGTPRKQVITELSFHSPASEVVPYPRAHTLVLPCPHHALLVLCECECLRRERGEGGVLCWASPQHSLPAIQRPCCLELGLT